MPIVRRPYPRGHYTLPPGEADSICKPLPQGRDPTPPPPTPPPEPPEERPVKAEPEEVKFHVAKVDPYEEEENAHLLLQSDTRVKQEPSESNAYVKSEPADLNLGTLNEMNELFRQSQALKQQTRSARSVKEESESSYPRLPASSAVKSEYESQESLSQPLKNKQSSVSTSIVKEERVDPDLNEMAELFRQRQAAKRQRQMQSTPTVKQESDTTGHFLSTSSTSTATIAGGPETRRFKREISESHLPEQRSILQNTSLVPSHFDRSTGGRTKKFKAED